MRIAITFLSVVILSASLLAQLPGQFMVALSGEDGKPLTSVDPSEFTVHENDQPTQVLKIEPTTYPTKVTLGVENSRGLADAIGSLRTGAKGFVNALPDGVEISLLSTAPTPRVVLKGTKNKADVLKAIDRLAPENSNGRYVEAVLDQLERWEKDKERGQYRPILVIMGSTSGDEQVRENWVREGMTRLGTINGAVVHSLMYQAPISVTGGLGESQMEFAREVSQRTRGRFETFSATQRMTTLLPELGAEVAKQSAGNQFIVTVERPSGATGKLGVLSLSPPNGVTVGKITRIDAK